MPLAVTHHFSLNLLYKAMNVAQMVNGNKHEDDTIAAEQTITPYLEMFMCQQKFKRNVSKSGMKCNENGNKRSEWIQTFFCHFHYNSYPLSYKFRLNFTKQVLKRA